MDDLIEPRQLPSLQLATRGRPRRQCGRHGARNVGCSQHLASHARGIADVPRLASNGCLHCRAGDADVEALVAIGHDQALCEVFVDEVRVLKVVRTMKFKTCMQKNAHTARGCHISG
jgi:hypothetical protein